MAARTVGRILRRHEVPRLAELDPPTGTVIRASKTTAVRYERARPGDDYVAAHGTERIERVMTDNAWSYRHGRALAA